MNTIALAIGAGIVAAAGGLVVERLPGTLARHVPRWRARRAHVRAARAADRARRGLAR